MFSLTFSYFCPLWCLLTVGSQCSQLYTRCTSWGPGGEITCFIVIHSEECCWKSCLRKPAHFLLHAVLCENYCFIIFSQDLVERSGLASIASISGSRRSKSNWMYCDTFQTMTNCSVKTMAGGKKTVCWQKGSSGQGSDKVVVFFLMISVTDLVNVLLRRSE